GLAVASVEWRVLHEQANDLAVGHVHHRLTGLGVAVADLWVRQRLRLVERIQIRAGQARRLALVEVCAQADVSVRQREHRLGLSERVELQRGLAQRPWLDGERRVLDHGACSSSDRSFTTTSAPWARSAPAWPTRSTPTTRPKFPARPASTPASASSNTAASAGSAPSARAPARNVSGAGFPSRCSRSASTPSMIAS